MAGSVAMFCQEAPSPAKLAAALILAFREMDAQLLTGKTAMLETYRQNCVTLGRDVSVVQGDSVRHGHAVSVDDQGALVVRFPDGHTEAVNAGEVSIRGMYGYA